MPITSFSIKKLTASAAITSSLLLGSLAAQAGNIGSSCPGMDWVPDATQASAVLSDVIQGAVTSYNFTVCNLSDPFGEGGFADAIRDWELPWDPNAGIDNIRVPFGWDWTIETRGVTNELTGWDAGAHPDTGWVGGISWQNPDDPFYDPRYANHTQVLHFYTGCGREDVVDAVASAVGATPQDCEQMPNNWIFAGGNNVLGGFGFDSPFSETNAPYQASWVALPINTGDPAFPLAGAFSPSFFAAASDIPEPTSLALMSLALFAAGRKYKKANI